MQMHISKVSIECYGSWWVLGHATSKIWILGLLNILSWRSMWKWQRQEGSSDLLLHSAFFSEADHKTLMWEMPSLYQEERSIFIFKDKRAPRWIYQAGLARFSQLLQLPHTPQPILSLNDGPFFIKLNIKIHRSVFWGLHFPMEAPLSRKTYIKYICILSPIKLSLQFTFQTQPGTLRGWRKTFLSPTKKILTSILLS